jgi:hypothetical protein
MFVPLFTIALTALVLWAIWSAVRPRPVFEVRISEGTPRIARGTVASAFVQEVGEVCRRHGVRDGAVRGVAQESGRISLTFSGDMPPSCRQQLRNIWSLSGWSTK